MAYTQLSMSPATIQFARSLNANSLHIGILGALPTGMLFLQFLAAIVANHLKYRRKLWLGVSVIQRLVLVPAALGPVLFPEISDVSWIWVLIALTALNHGMLHFATPLWLSWMGDYLPRNGLSSFWGVRQLWMQWTGAVSLFLAAVFLLYGGLEIRQAFSVLLGAGAVFGLLDLVLFLKVEEPPVSPAPEPRLRDVVSAPFRDRDFRSFIGFTCFWHFAAMTGAPFISLFLLQHTGLDLFRLLMLWVFSWVGGAALSSRLGQLTEEVGNRPVLIICTAFKSLNMIALCLIPRNPEVAFWIMLPVFVIDSVLNAGIAIANNGFMLKNSPTSNRTMFIAAGTAMAGMIGGLTSIAAGAVLVAGADWQTTWQGREINSFHLLFAASLALRLVAAGLAFRIREKESRGAFQVASQMIGVTPLRILRFPVGLYRAWQGESEVNSRRTAGPAGGLPLPADRRPVAAGTQDHGR